MVRKQEMFEVAVGLVKQYILAKVLTPKTPNDSWYVLLSSIGSLRDAPKTKCERTHYRRTDGQTDELAPIDTPRPNNLYHGKSCNLFLIEVIETVN